MSIRYETKLCEDLTSESVLELFTKSGIDKPNWTPERMQRALRGSSIVVTAWYEANLIGFASAISDFAWVAYLSQLAVDPKYQGQGIGKHLLENLRIELGEEVTLIVHSAEASTAFYQKVGFVPYSNVYRIPRRK